MNERRRLLIDLGSSYALSVARVASMAAMVAIFYRYANAEYAATFILVRTMLGLLNNAFAGVGPTTQRWLARAAQTAPPVAAMPAFAVEVQVEYRSATRTARRQAGAEASAYLLTLTTTLALVAAAALVVMVYTGSFTFWHDVAITRAWQAGPFATSIGAGLLFRAASEPAGALLQSRNRLEVDNVIGIAGELLWPLLCLPLVGYSAMWNGALLEAVGHRFLAVSVGVFFVRHAVAAYLLRDDLFAAIGQYDITSQTPGRFAWQSVVTAIGSLADFLYAPANLLIISACIHPKAVADYTPALQFDAALLLLVGAIAATMLPRAMRLAGEGRKDDLRTLYLRSTLASFAILAIAAAATWLAAPTILRLWLGQPMPVTLAVLPFVLVHTVLGGTAGVGRATLLAMGRFRAYTISAVVGGVANVMLALLFVVGCGWGLRGVAIATIVAVFGRCAIWMPWYVLRSLR